MEAASLPLGRAGVPPATDAFIFVSDVEREMYLRAGVARPEQSVTVHNGVATMPPPDIDRAAVRSRVGCDPNAVLATFVGRLAAQKGLDVLIEARRDLGDASPLQILIVDYGTDEATLSAQRGLAAAGRLVFGGYQPQERVQRDPGARATSSCSRRGSSASPTPRWRRSARAYRAW